MFNNQYKNNYSTVNWLSKYAIYKIKDVLFWDKWMIRHEMHLHIRDNMEKRQVFNLRSSKISQQIEKKDVSKNRKNEAWIIRKMWMMVP